MGACYCRPQTLVTEDPNVVIHTEVGFCVRMGMYQSDFTQLSRFGGLAYVKNTGHLCLESTVGSRFCCLCCRHGWRLSDIIDVMVVTGNITVTRRDRYGTHRSTHQMNPGLQVKLNNGDKIVMQMPDAMNVCARLRQLCNLPSTNPGQQVLENLIWQAIIGGHVRSTRSTPSTSAPRTSAPRTRPGTMARPSNPATIVRPSNPAIIVRPSNSGALVRPSKLDDTEPLLT